MIFDDYEDIMAFVQARYAVSREAIISRDRTRRTSYARAMVAMMLRERGHSLSAIGNIMGREHTSIMRMCRYNKPRLVETLQFFMTAEQIAAAEAAAEEEARMAAAEREAESAELEAIIANVVVYRPELKQYDTGCIWTRRWVKAIARAGESCREARERVWKEEMNLLFPYTAATPSALYGAS